MRWLVVVVLVAACDGSGGGGGGGSRLPDAARPPNQQTCNPPPGPLCGSKPTCGNGKIDSCYWATMPGHCNYNADIERCDGNQGTCESAGYYGGTTVCDWACQHALSTTCEACPTGSTSCVTLPALRFERGAVSGTRIALASSTDSQLEILDGLAVAATTQVYGIRDITSVPGGWLVLTDDGLRSYGSDGTVGQPVPLPGILGTRLVYGAGGRVLIAWRDTIDAQEVVRYAIASTSGTVLVPATTALSIPNVAPFSITTSASSFFIASAGQLARIASDGTLAVVSGYDTATVVTAVLWGATTGWYVTGGTVQRFDANGTQVASPFAITGQPIADGDELLAVDSVSGRIVLTRLTAAGTIVTTVSDFAALAGAQAMFFARIGADIYVVWTRDGHLQIARAAI